jgi:Xaa-Pro aminopeptidase
MNMNMGLHLGEKAIFQRRIRFVQTRMAGLGLDLLVVSAPENMHYLTGYDGWSFYLNQCLLLASDRATPLWIGRSSDTHVAQASPVIDPADIHTYGDQYIQSHMLSPYDFVADQIVSMGWAQRRIGVPTDDYYFSPRAFSTLARRLPNATIVDDAKVVNWVRAIKEPGEIQAIRRAGQIAVGALLAGVCASRPGARTADTAAAVLRALTVPEAGFVGSYSAIAPLIIDGDGPARPHTTWSDAVFGDAGSFVLELAGVYGRYHCPIARTVCLGEPPAIRRAAAEAQAECLRTVESVAKPGTSCGELAQRCAATLAKHGFSKAGRFGYSTGIAYPPDWGEHTVSVRANETTILERDMVLFFIPALWGHEWSVAVGETFHITDEGAHRITDRPYDLIVV